MEREPGRSEAVIGGEGVGRSRSMVGVGEDPDEGAGQEGSGCRIPSWCGGLRVPCWADRGIREWHIVRNTLARLIPRRATHACSNCPPGFAPPPLTSWTGRLRFL
ncbi:hypothetical protein E2C01_005012 [Portunus trituberculatus]|uniref:Uncharacterized protein n=1 Tax=Portunus trituberculatus TaxID=210409 RepID=A0A5B7CVG5_PORTR|nr:hypothetical protein [Portunus trituberculatus]